MTIKIKSCSRLAKAKRKRKRWVKNDSAFTFVRSGRYWYKSIKFSHSTLLSLFLSRSLSNGVNRPLDLLDVVHTVSDRLGECDGDIDLILRSAEEVQLLRIPLQL